MTVRSRIVVAVLWSLSLVAVSQWTASAQMRQMPTPGIGPGHPVRFVPTKNTDGSVTGNLMAEINGSWLTVTLDSGGPVRKPLGGQ